MKSVSELWNLLNRNEKFAISLLVICILTMILGHIGIRLPPSFANVLYIYIGIVGWVFLAFFTYWIWVVEPFFISEDFGQVIAIFQMILWMVNLGLIFV